MLFGNSSPPPQRCAHLGCWPSISRWPHASAGVIGLLEDAVDAGALWPRVDLFRQKSTCRGLQPLPDVATRRQTREKKKHVNYDLSDVVRCSHDGKCLSQFPIRARTTMQKIVYFFGESTWWRKREIHNADAIVGTGRVRRGRGKGGGVLLALGTESCLVEDTTCQRDGNVIIVASFLVAGGSIFNLWERQTPSFCNIVACASDTPVQLRCQNCERNLASWQKISHRGQFWLRWCSTKLAKLAREGGGRCFGSQVSSVRKL